ncbi:predicted protein [Chaetoceros tenuissimus]|uniref:Uncharacterized protein n=1 Tax=Chaetoceros tenuissimus TaxID=426638 RepID=A0AAD3CVC8_9STRA|nr:predicted protein [Chaetoceros tenuissimus]
MRTYLIRIECDRYMALYLFRILPSTPFRKVAKAYREMMCEDRFKFYLGDHLIADNDDSIEEIIQGTAFFRSRGEIRVKAILDQDVGHYFYFLIKEYRLGLGLEDLSTAKAVKAKPSELFSKIADAFCKRKGGRFVFLLNGFEIDDKKTAVQIFQDMLVQRKENEYDVFITAILEENYVRDE